MALSSIKSSVKSKANFNIEDLTPIKEVDSCFIPALFSHAHDDNFIKPHHSDDIYAKYAGDKNITKVDGDHNTPRPQFFMDSAGIFLTQALQVPPQLMLDPEMVHMGRLPWHQGGMSRFYAARNPILSPIASPEEGPDGRFAMENLDEEQLQRVLTETLMSPDEGGARPAPQHLKEPLPSPEKYPEQEPEEEKVKMIVEMGFAEEQAKAALKLTGNDVEASIQWILSQ
jgi:hypothetical protein